MVGSGGIVATAIAPRRKTRRGIALSRRPRGFLPHYSTRYVKTTFDFKSALLEAVAAQVGRAVFQQYLDMLKSVIASGQLWSRSTAAKLDSTCVDFIETGATNNYLGDVSLISWVVRQHNRVSVTSAVKFGEKEEYPEPAALIEINGLFFVNGGL